MTQPLPARLEGSYLAPSFEHARVGDAMRSGVISCMPDSTMEEVARMMAMNHVHAIVVTGFADVRPWGVVTDRDVMEVATSAAERLAGTCADHEPVTVSAADPLEKAARLMQERGISHVLVADPDRDLPLGVLSTLDIAGVIAWGRA